MIEDLNHISLNAVKDADRSVDSDDVVLSINHVSKRFCRDLKRSLVYAMQDITTDLLGLRQERDSLRPREFWALHDVSFQLRRGEALGLVGKNGSGKSTLLRVIAGLIKPDAGSVDIRGRVAPLIALGAGFNPILTGRENIYNNMSILGLSKQEINERFDEVVEFAEIGDAIDSPVQSYSSGMGSRLGFSCAIHTEPEILLLDEVLAVGDIRFRAKCYRKLHNLRQQGTAFIFVSHSTQAILNICESSVYLKQGKLISSGETSAVMNLYEQDLFSWKAEQDTGEMKLPPKKAGESEGVDIRQLFFRDKYNSQIQILSTGELTQLCIRCKVHKHFTGIGFRLVVREACGEQDILLFINSYSDSAPLDLIPGECEIRVKMPYLSLKPGLYAMNIHVLSGLYTLDVVESFKFLVDSNRNFGTSLFFQPTEWKVWESESSQRQCS
jgi:lipopolysaccharide transport system ATP-binding protein